MSKPDLKPQMRKSEYAQYRGVSKARVSQWVKEARIPVLSNGQIDVAAADFALGETRQRAVSKDSSSSETPFLPSAERSLTRARAEEAEYSAKLKRLQLDRELGNLLPITQVADAATACAAEMMRALSLLSARSDDLFTAVTSEGHAGAKRILRIIERDLRAVASDAFAKLARNAAATPETEPDQHSAFEERNDSSGREML